MSRFEAGSHSETGMGSGCSPPESWSGRSVLLTGSRGFVGTHLKRHLESAGADVRELLRPERDLTLPETLAGCCDGVDVVIHAAGSAHVNHIDADQVRAVNVAGTANLLFQAQLSGVKKFVLVSSILADPAFDSPRSDYGKSKSDAESLLVQACESQAMQKDKKPAAMTGIIARPVNVYGPGMRGNLMTLLTLIQRRKLPPLPRLDGRLALVGVDDLSRALMAMAEPASLGQELTAMGQVESVVAVYPVTDGQCYQFKDIELGIRHACGQQAPSWSLPAPICHAAVLVAEMLGRLLPWKNVPGLRTWRTITRDHPVDDSKTRLELGYNPRSNFYDALPSILDDEQRSGSRQ